MNYIYVQVITNAEQEMGNSMKVFIEHERLANLDRAYRRGRKQQNLSIVHMFQRVKDLAVDEQNAARLDAYKDRLLNIESIPRTFTAKNTTIMEMIR